MKPNLPYRFAPIILITAFSCRSHQPAVAPVLEGKVKMETISVVPKLGGRIEQIRVEEGQQVEAGDTVAVLSMPELGAKMQQAEGAIESAAGQLELARNGATSEQLMQLQSQAEAADAQYQFAQVSFQRMENMFRDSLIPAQQMDDARTKMKMAAAQSKAAKARLKEIQAGTRPETIQAARGLWIRAMGSREELKEANRERYLVAPAAMTVESISLKVGELALPGYTLVNGYASNTVYFRFTIGAQTVNRFPNGSSVVVDVPNTHQKIASRIVAVKQLPRYAENSSTAPNREMAEAFYELKVVPVLPESARHLIYQSTVVLPY